MQRDLVMTSGAFDLLHIGHVRFLESASRLGSWLCVALNSDESVQKLKGIGHPVIPFTERCEMLWALHIHLEVIEYDGNSEELLSFWQPEIFVKGADWRGKNIPEEKLVQQYGGRVEYISSGGPHTSDIIRKIKGDS
jgi:rfaE bifunctional protein nucleotidyltransferase chain/domain